MVITILFVKTSNQLSFINGINSALYYVSIKEILMTVGWWDFLQTELSRKKFISIKIIYLSIIYI